MIQRLAIIVLGLALSGCASILPLETQLYQQNRFAELRDYMEPIVAPKAVAPSSELLFLCYSYSKIRDYSKLYACLDRLQARMDAGDTLYFMEDYSAVPSLLRTQAAIEFSDYTTAIAQSEIAYRLTRTTKASVPMKVYALSFRALAYALAGRTDEARRFTDELAAFQPGWQGVVAEADKAIGLARVRMALGDYAGAIAAVDSDKSEGSLAMTALSVVTANAKVSTLSFWELPKRVIRARALLELGQYDKARAAYDGILNEIAIEQNADLLWMVLDDRGRIAAREGDLAGAVRYWQRAIDQVEMQRATIRAEAGRIGFVGDKQALYRRMVAALMAKGDAAGAFAFAERAKARALLDLLGSRDLRRVARAAPVKELVAEVQQAQQELAMIDPGRPFATRSLKVARLSEQLRQAAPGVAALITAQSPTAQQVQALLPAGETLVEYFGGGDELVAFVLSPTAIAAVKLDGKGLAEDVQALRGAMQQPDKGSPILAAQLMHARVLAPLLPLIQGEQIAIVPHGPLHYLPFAALHDGKRFVVETKSLRMLPAAGVLPYLVARRSAGQGLLLVGNPDVGKPELDLPHAQIEAEAIHKSWPNSTLLVRKNASKEGVTKVIGGYSRLHFASHGVFNPETPLASGLLLAPNGERDGMLTVAELYELQLEADLVTLSACETGLGAISSGDDVVGLNRGFLFAGTRTIVSSLWSVEDEATKDLMIGFYANLPNHSRREALRQAQMAVKAKSPHPFYWAAFQLTGDGQ